MEIKPGMFVSHADDRGLGSPTPRSPGSTMHELVHDGPMWAGHDADRRRARADDLDARAARGRGRARGRASGSSSPTAPTSTLGVGDIATIPAGMTTTWHVTTPFKEMWVLAEA